MTNQETILVFAALLLQAILVFLAAWRIEKIEKTLTELVAKHNALVAETCSSRRLTHD